MLLVKLGDGRSVGTAGVAWTARARERASQAPGEAKQDPSDAPTSNHGDGLDSGGRVQADVEWDDGFQAAHEMEAPAPIGSGCRDKRGSVVWIGILRWLGMDPRPLKMVPLNSKGQGKGKGKGTCTRRLSPGGCVPVRPATSRRVRSLHAGLSVPSLMETRCCTSRDPMYRQ